MIKISFELKKLDADWNKLEYITIGNPKKILDSKPLRDYACEVYLSDKKINIPVTGRNPIEALCLATEFIKTYLQAFIGNGYTISEVENQGPWKLEKLSDTFVVDKINSYPNLSEEGKQKIFKVLRETFGSISPSIRDQLNKAYKKKLNN